MSPFDEQEFWNALGRVYDATVGLVQEVGDLSSYVNEHDKRLYAAEVTIPAILEDMRRLRGRS